MSDSSIEEELESLRSAVLSWRFPMVIVGGMSALSMLLFGGLLVVTTLASLASLSSPWSSPVAVVFQIVLMWGFFGVVLMPVQLLLRAAIAGLQARTNPKKALQMARLHERYWTWVLGILCAYVGLMFLFVLMTGC